MQNIAKSMSNNLQIKINMLWNFMGSAVPILVAILTIPVLIENLGVEKFGVLSIAWIVVGYFGFFDFGLGRAMTQVISQKIGLGQKSEVSSIAFNGMCPMFLLGIAGGLIVAVLSPWLVNNKIKIPPEIQSETLISFFILSFSVPIVVFTTGLRGIIEGLHRFDIVNIIRIPFSALTYIGPLLILQYSNKLYIIVSILVIIRFIMLIFNFIAVVYFFPNILYKKSLNVSLQKKLLSFGGWMTLSNVAAPFLLYLGRFALAAMISMDAVTYFSTPYDVVINLLLVPGIFVSTLFPIFSEKFVTAKNSVRAFYNQWIKNMFLLMFPITLICFFFAKIGLSLWINKTFAEQSYRIAEILIIGIFINSFGYISQTLIQASGRPSWTAKLHVVELILYVPYMWVFIQKYGTEGAAIAWTVRVTISTMSLAFLANLCLNNLNSKKG